MAAVRAGLRAIAQLLSVISCPGNQSLPPHGAYPATAGGGGGGLDPPCLV